MRFVAWILIQALAVSQISPSFLFAQETTVVNFETLRNSQLKGVGLEQLTDALQVKSSDQSNKARVSDFTAGGLEEPVIRLKDVQVASSWFDIFGNDRPVVLEIGPGNADALYRRAEKEPHLNFLGVGPQLPNRFGIGPYPPPSNVRFLKADIRTVLHRLPLALRSLQKIYIDFPPVASETALRLYEDGPGTSPLPKNSYIFDGSTVSGLMSMLPSGGEFTLRTESKAILSAVEQAMRQQGGEVSLTLSRAFEHEGMPESVWSRNFEEKGVRTYLLHYRKADQKSGLEEEGVGFRPLNGLTPQEVAERTKIAVIGGGRFMLAELLGRILYPMHSQRTYDGLALLVQPQSDDVARKLNNKTDGRFKLVTASADGTLAEKEISGVIAGVGSIGGHSEVGILRLGQESAIDAFFRSARLPIEIVAIGVTEGGIAEESHVIKSTTEYLLRLFIARPGRRISVINTDNIPRNGMSSDGTFYTTLRGLIEGKSGMINF